MYPLFETLQIKDGQILNIEWHEKRYQTSYYAYYGQYSTKNLIRNIKIPLSFQQGIVKLKISYNLLKQRSDFQQYPNTPIQTLKIIHDNTIDYQLKYTDRSHLQLLVEQKGDCDNILIVKNGEITDTSFTNIVFYDGMNWFTPLNPLLKGTCRAKLLQEQRIQEKIITLDNLFNFQGFQLINALRPLKENQMIPMDCIIK